MNNIYVEGELPDNCKACQYKSIGRCVLSDKNVFDYMVYETSPEECPIKPLSVRLAEERKKVVQEIKDKISDGLYQNSYGETFIDGDIYKILDQIEGVSDDNK